MKYIMNFNFIDSMSKDIVKLNINYGLDELFENSRHKSNYKKNLFSVMNVNYIRELEKLLKWLY